MWVSHLEKLTFKDLGEDDKGEPSAPGAMIRVKAPQEKQQRKRGSQIRFPGVGGGNSNEPTISQLNQELQQLKVLLDNEQRAREQLASLCVSLAERVTELENMLRAGNAQPTTSLSAE
eukprot:TRINITY_DN1804_c0_g2_i2.p1 TRINITY_DN1804_c0_g2~~TRINITY_DN1804_c0_g2_i2.p1  ORF type:complete len:131 (-),score=23.21 TRINITY_DN1804_c0_g2_i2:266-619(-)